MIFGFFSLQPGKSSSPSPKKPTLPHPSCHSKPQPPPLFWAKTLSRPPHPHLPKNERNPTQIHREAASAFGSWFSPKPTQTTAAAVLPLEAKRRRSPPPPPSFLKTQLLSPGSLVFALPEPESQGPPAISDPPFPRLSRLKPPNRECHLFPHQQTFRPSLGQAPSTGQQQHHPFSSSSLQRQ